MEELRKLSKKNIIMISVIVILLVSMEITAVVHVLLRSVNAKWRDDALNVSNSFLEEADELHPFFSDITYEELTSNDFIAKIQGCKSIDIVSPTKAQLDENYGKYFIVLTGNTSDDFRYAAKWVFVKRNDYYCVYDVATIDMYLCTNYISPLVVDDFMKNDKWDLIQ